MISENGCRQRIACTSTEGSHITKNTQTHAHTRKYTSTQTQKLRHTDNNALRSDGNRGLRTRQIQPYKNCGVVRPYSLLTAQLAASCTTDCTATLGAQFKLLQRVASRLVAQLAACSASLLLGLGGTPHAGRSRLRDGRAKASKTQPALTASQ